MSQLWRRSTECGRGLMEIFISGTEDEGEMRGWKQMGAHVGQTGRIHWFSFLRVREASDGTFWMKENQHFRKAGA